MREAEGQRAKAKGKRAKNGSLSPFAFRLSPLLIIWSFLLPSQLLAAQVPSVAVPAPVPSDQLQPGKCGDRKSAVAAINTVLPPTSGIPSLWLTRETFEAKEKFEGRLVNNWLVCPADSTTPGRIDLIVNSQSWTILDYIERYDFVNRFGDVAQSYGYNFIVFNGDRQGKQRPLAIYTCNFGTTPHQCVVDLQVTGKARVRGAAPQGR